MCAPISTELHMCAMLPPPSTEVYKCATGQPLPPTSSFCKEEVEDHDSFVSYHSNRWFNLQCSCRTSVYMSYLVLFNGFFRAQVVSL